MGKALAKGWREEVRWQVHEVAYAGEPDRHLMKGGVMDALDRAKA